MPEIIFEKAWVKGQNVLTEPNVNGCFAIVSSERISSFLGPNVNHLASCHSERVCKYCTDICSDTCCKSHQRKDWETGISPKNRKLIDQPIIQEKRSQWAQRVLHKERESVFEKIVWPFFKRNSLESVQKALVALLQFFGEGFVRVICP